MHSHVQLLKTVLQASTQPMVKDAICTIRVHRRGSGKPDQVARVGNLVGGQRHAVNIQELVASAKR